MMRVSKVGHWISNPRVIKKSPQYCGWRTMGINAFSYEFSLAVIDQRPTLLQNVETEEDDRI